MSDHTFDKTLVNQLVQKGIANLIEGYIMIDCKDSKKCSGSCSSSFNSGLQNLESIEWLLEDGRTLALLNPRICRFCSKRHDEQLDLLKRDNIAKDQRLGAKLMDEDAKLVMEKLLLSIN